jgi:hypothetical protein
MIFRRYFLYLVYWWRKGKYRILKPLGLCVYCQNFWINALLYPLIFGGYDSMFILSVGGSYVSVEAIRRMKRD